MCWSSTALSGPFMPAGCNSTPVPVTRLRVGKLDGPEAESGLMGFVTGTPIDRVRHGARGVGEVDGHRSDRSARHRIRIEDATLDPVVRSGGLDERP